MSTLKGLKACSWSLDIPSGRLMGICPSHAGVPADVPADVIVMRCCGDCVQRMSERLQLRWAIRRRIDAVVSPKTVVRPERKRPPVTNLGRELELWQHDVNDSEHRRKFGQKFKP